MKVGFGADHAVRVEATPMETKASARTLDMHLLRQRYYPRMASRSGDTVAGDSTWLVSQQRAAEHLQ